MAVTRAWDGERRLILKRCIVDKDFYTAERNSRIMILRRALDAFLNMKTGRLGDPWLAHHTTAL